MKDFVTLSAKKSGEATITLNANDDIQITQINSDKTINITSTNGKLIDGSSVETPNLISNHLKLVSSNGVGTSTNDLDTQVNTIEITNSKSGGVYIDEVNQLNVNSINSFSDIVLDAVGITQSGDMISTSGSINVRSTSGIVMSSNTKTAASQGSINYSATDALTVSKLDALNSIDLNASKITQTGNIKSIVGSVQLRSESSISMTQNTKTSVDNKSITYIANGDINLSILDSKSGNIDLKTNDTSEILDVNNNHETNITANTFNMIGHGAFGRGINADDASFTNLKNKAIETNVSRVYISTSNKEDAQVEILIGKDTSATLIEKSQYSLQFVNNGLFLNSTSLLQSDNVIDTSGFDAVEEYKFTKVVDYQQLDFLAKNSDDLADKVQANRRSKLSKLMPEAVMNENIVQSLSSIQSSNIFQESGFDNDFKSNDDILSLNSDIDFLSLEDNNMIPAFGLNYIDDSILDNEEDEGLMFEYWIENIAI